MTRISYQLSVVAFLFLSFFAFQSCNDEENGVVRNTQETTVGNGQLHLFKSDLKILIVKQKSLISKIRAEKSVSTRASDKTEDYYSQIDDNLRLFLEKFDLGSDLTPHELEGLMLEQEEIDIIARDTAAYRNYIQEYKTTAFCDVYEHFVQDPNESYPLLEKALDNPHLKMNELLSLSLLMCALDQDFASFDPEPGVQAAVSCYDEYMGARRACLIDYAVDCGLSFASGAVTWGAVTIVGVGWATKGLYNCLDHALQDYRRCRKYIEGK